MDKLKADKFGQELRKIMPGYKWTVKRPKDYLHFVRATGTRSLGFNRLSTLEVIRRERESGDIEYEVKGAGYGTRSEWLSEYTAETLAQALRGLQEHYEYQAGRYRDAAHSLRDARKPKAIKC